MSANTRTKTLPSFLFLLCLILSLFSSAAADGESTDFAASVRPGDQTLQLEVTVASFVDGDTTHFCVPDSLVPGGLLKARYLAINTPETTGKIEEYGPAAARFTRERLENAQSILIESDDENLNLDSTGGRYLVWVWYRESEDAPYRNLNIELLQNGLAVPYSASNNRYGQTCVAATAQARKQKLNLFSGQPDPDYYYGDALEVTLRQLREDPEAYAGKKVAFSGVVTMNWAQCVYLEDYDEETDRTYGMQVYYGYSLSGGGLEILHVGNRARVVGVVSYYEAGETWQVSDVSYRMMRPDDPDNLRKLDEGLSPAYTPLTVSQLDPLRVASSVSLDGLRVTNVQAHESEDVSKSRALSLTCTQDGLTVTVWVAPMQDSPFTPEDLAGKLISVKGLVDVHEGSLRIRVFTPDGLSLANE